MSYYHSYNLNVITETWWDKSHKWNTAVNGYKLFKRDKQGSRDREGRRSGKGIVLYLNKKKKKRIDCTELPFKNSNE